MQYLEQADSQETAEWWLVTRDWGRGVMGERELLMGKSFCLGR